MALFKKKAEEAPPLADEAQGPKATTPDWNAPARERAGTGPNGFKISNLEFGSTGNGGQVPALERLGLGELMNATAFDTADLKANHIEPGVLTGMLADAMEHLETNFANGVYDAAAMPLVEEYLAEMRNLAMIQAERNAIIAERVADVKEANSMALQAVFSAREERARKIQERYDAAQEKWRRKQDDKEALKEAARMKKLRRVAEEQELSDLESARKVRQAAQEEADRQRAAVNKALEERRRTVEAEIQTNERRRASVEAVTKAEQVMQEEFARLNVIREELDREMNDARLRKIQYVANAAESVLHNMDEQAVRAQGAADAASQAQAAASQAAANAASASAAAESASAHASESAHAADAARASANESAAAWESANFGNETVGTSIETPDETTSMPGEGSGANDNAHPSHPDAPEGWATATNASEQEGGNQSRQSRWFNRKNRNNPSE